MTGTDFAAWLAEMKASGLAKTDAACGRLLGIHKNSVLKLKLPSSTADKKTALACAALLHNMAPYSSIAEALNAVKAVGVAGTDREIAELLGAGVNSLAKLRSQKTVQRRWLLACRALVHRLEPVCE